MIYYSNYVSNNHNLSIMLSYHIIIKVLRSQDRIKNTKKSTNHHITRMAMATMSARVKSLITMMASLRMFPTNLIRPSWPGRCFQGFLAWRMSRLLSPPSSCRSGQDDDDDHARESDDGDEDGHPAYFHQTKSHGDPTAVTTLITTDKTPPYCGNICGGNMVLSHDMLVMTTITKAAATVTP